MRTSGTSTYITKLLSTFTSHGGASLNPFDPVFALRTLFEFSSFDKLDEILVSFVECVRNFVLGTCHSFVIDASTLQAIMGIASWASVVIKSFFDFEDSCAACSWTPRSCSIFFNKFVETKFLEFLFQFRISVLMNVANFYNASTLFYWTLDIRLSILDF